MMRTNYIRQEKYILIRFTRLLYILLLAIIPLSGQSPSYQLPTIIRPSPTAQNFMRYGEIPVDYSTGVPQIEIPIYTVHGKKIQLPISLSYHSSGIKVTDVSSEAGIGWVLNAGGIVSRTMLDVYDENGGSIKTYSNAEQFLSAVPNIVLSGFNQGCNCYSGSHAMEMMLTTKFGNEDLMSDRYFYKLPSGNSGIFRYNYPNRDTLITLPYRPYKINRTVDDQFKITDDNGILYTFKRFQDSGHGISEWLLIEIQAADETENIKLNYIQQQSSSKIASANILFTKKQFINGNDCFPQGHDLYPTDQPSGTGESMSSIVLSSIESNEDLITFSYGDREDFQHLKRIIEIRIAKKRTPAVINKKVNFNHSYFGDVGYSSGNSLTINKRLKLNSINIFDETNSIPQSYSFTYEQNIMLPPYISRSFDFWGYYNGSNNNTAIPEDILSPDLQGQGYGGNRKADNGEFSKAYMLKEIKYPSGGSTKFEFERAYVSGLLNSSNSAGYIGGFRVSKITNYSKANEIADIKSYQYSGPKYNLIDSEFYGYLQRFIDNNGNTQASGNFIAGCWEYYTRAFVTSTPIISHDLMPGLPIAYSSVFEYNGTPNDNNGSTEYSYTFPNNISYTIPLRELHPYQEDQGNYQPKLYYKLIKSKSGNKISEEYYNYSNHFEKAFHTGIHVVPTLTNLAFFKNIDLSTHGCPNCVTDYIQSIKAHNTTALQKADLMNYSISKVYDQHNQGKYIQDSTLYIYNQHNLMVQETTTINSRGENIQTQYKYPSDFTSVQPYQTMLNKNILTPVIEQIVSNIALSKQIQKIQTSYKDWGNNIIEPEIIKGQMDAASPLENRIRYLSYDSKGNPMTVKKEVGNPLTYLWGYNKSLPIAAVENAKYISEILNNDINVTFSGLQISMGNTPYELGTFTITEEKNYKVDRTYERYPENHSVMYQIVFQDVNNSTNYVSFTDNMPGTENSHTYTSQLVKLKPGTYKVKLINIGYNGYQGQIENNFNFTVYNPVEASIPFHISFEEESVNVSTAYAMTGKSSHTGDYVVNLPSGNLGYDKVIVSYWGKASASSPWQYVENIVTLGNTQNYLIGTNYAYIDEVRVYPLDARMTTYTYDPFHKTQTSIMNENGQTEYYDYDASGRLKEVYMIEGNVKKTVRTTNYHYKP